MENIRENQEHIEQIEIEPETFIKKLLSEIVLMKPAKEKLTEDWEL